MRMVLDDYWTAPYQPRVAIWQDAVCDRAEARKP